MPCRIRSWFPHPHSAQQTAELVHSWVRFSCGLMRPWLREQLAALGVCGDQLALALGTRGALLSKDQVPREEQERPSRTVCVIPVPLGVAIDTDVSAHA